MGVTPSELASGDLNKIGTYNVYQIRRPEMSILYHLMVNFLSPWEQWR